MAANPSLAVEPGAREGRLFCAKPHCGKGFAAWVQCSARGCPKLPELVERSQDKTADGVPAP